jgi:hypothetical protein
MPGFFADLINRATGLKAGLLAEGNQNYSGIGPQETDMDVPRDPEATYSDPYTNVKKIDTKFGPTNKSSPFKYDPVTGKPMDAATGQQATSNFPIQQGKIDPIKEGESKIGLSNKQAVKFLGMDMTQISENWKDKGGFEGLMSNPAFTLGLSIMQSSAQGKPIGADIFDNAVKAGAVSAQYADRIKSRAAVMAPISDSQRDEVRSVLAESDIYESSIGQKIKNIFKGKNLEALNKRALDDVYERAESIVRKEAGSKGGQAVRVKREHIEKAVRSLEKEGKLELTEKGIASYFFGRGIQSKTTGLAKGGPVEAGKDYVVGEEGPEMFVSETNGTIINNDDSKVVSMLLESNPQLNNVSRARAVKILKARFPDYF